MHSIYKRSKQRDKLEANLENKNAERIGLNKQHFFGKNQWKKIKITTWNSKKTDRKLIRLSRRWKYKAKNYSKLRKKQKYF